MELLTPPARGPLARVMQGSGWRHAPAFDEGLLLRRQHEHDPEYPHEEGVIRRSAVAAAAVATLPPPPFGKTADLNNASDHPFADAITAALFLAEFVEPACPWAHLDVMAWNLHSRPGRPEGGEAMAVRALYAALAGRFRDSVA